MSTLIDEIATSSLLNSEQPREKPHRRDLATRKVALEQIVRISEELHAGARGFSNDMSLVVLTQVRARMMLESKWYSHVYRM